MAKNIEMDHITIIVPQGQGQEVLKLAKQKGIANGTVSRGFGTANKELYSELEKVGKTRDFVSVLAAMDMAEIFLEKLNEEFQFSKPGHGIAYAVNVNEVYTEGLSQMESDPSDYQVITAIIRNGHADKVMDAARAAGATGGTVLEDGNIQAPDHSLFSKDTDGNDEIVLIISKMETTQAIMDAVRMNAGLDRETGLIYIQDAHFVYGVNKWAEQKKDR